MKEQENKNESSIRFVGGLLIAVLFMILLMIMGLVLDDKSMSYFFIVWVVGLVCSLIEVWT